MTLESYIDKIMREIRVPRDAKKRIKEDLESDVSTRIDCGMTMNEIINEFGEPKQAAKSLVDNLPLDMRYRGSPVRFIYILAGVGVLVIGLYDLWGRYLKYHPSSGFASQWEYFIHEITLRYDVFIWLFVNLVLMLIVCLTGYLFFKKKWNKKEKKLLIAMIILTMIFIVQQPIVYGVAIVSNPSVLWERLVSGLIQPQCILTMCSIYAISVTYFKGYIVQKNVVN